MPQGEVGGVSLGLGGVGGDSQAHGRGQRGVTPREQKVMARGGGQFIGQDEGGGRGRDGDSESELSSPMASSVTVNGMQPQ